VLGSCELHFIYALPCANVKKEFSCLSARDLFHSAPDDLPALLLAQRPAQQVPTRVLAVGDIGLSGRVRARVEQNGFEAAWGETHAILRQGDILFGNLECTLSDVIPSSSLFTGPSSSADALAKAGFSVMHLANNHVYDYGSSGARGTINAIRKAGIRILGAGETKREAAECVITETRGIKLGWLGCGHVLQPQNPCGPNLWVLKESELLRAVRMVRGSADALIVSMHTGYMYLDYPGPDQKVMAEHLISAGVDLILMHHAHILQGIELRDSGRLICYNLGNFLFDWEEGNVKGDVMVDAQREGAIFVFDFDRGGICKAAVLPTWQDDSCCIRWAVGERGHKILGRLSQLSNDLAGDFSAAFFQQRAERNTGHALKVLWFHARRCNVRYLVSSLLKIRLHHAMQFLRWLAGLGRKNRQS